MVTTTRKEDSTQPPIVTRAARVWVESVIHLVFTMAGTNQSAEVPNLVSRVVGRLALTQEFDNHLDLNQHLNSALDQLRLIAGAARPLESGGSLLDPQLGGPPTMSLDDARLKLVRERCRAGLHRPPNQPASLELLARLEVALASSLSEKRSRPEARTWAN